MKSVGVPVYKVFTQVRFQIKLVIMLTTFTKIHELNCFMVYYIFGDKFLILKLYSACCLLTLFLINDIFLVWSSYVNRICGRLPYGIFHLTEWHAVLLYNHQQQIRNKYTNITLLTFVYYVFLLHVSIQLNPRQFSWSVPLIIELYFQCGSISHYNSCVLLYFLKIGHKL